MHRKRLEEGESLQLGIDGVIKDVEPGGRFACLGNCYDLFVLQELTAD